ncbi:hypothetical protein PP175_07585 [Aneurinibacillus sp. Ricciae_BoGa-3]|uniref:hypothetical protein n=1 Tax=Aneurinibacillus sp. Ricciae_BoGa-3 TaxID=3022697 RepID=UPI0023408E3C|nr:hypothetical protein [Aneurinibacillus sp. Ricciae_BoGa-3]WCK55787.1 hypothetical protein PP175_07585 [Aneurinibacillus sp. Ricciae_BoGa-3]
MPKTSWRVIGKISRPLGPVWVVIRRKRGKKQKGYFKFATRKNQKRVGPLLANEMISYRLGNLLKLNVATILRARIKGKQGTVSLVKPARNHYTWKQLDKKLEHPVIYYIKNRKELLKTLVFDMWICNLDRHGDNLIVYPTGTKLNFYLIDHGLALLGAVKWRKEEWDSPYWNHVTKYNKHYPSGLIPYIYSYRQLSPYVQMIQNTPVSKIKQVVNSTPASILPARSKRVVIKLLLKRQKKLDVIVRLWFKEYFRTKKPLK